MWQKWICFMFFFPVVFLFCSSNPVDDNSKQPPQDTTTNPIVVDSPDVINTGNKPDTIGYVSEEWIPFDCVPELNPGVSKEGLRVYNGDSCLFIISDADAPLNRTNPANKVLKIIYDSVPGGEAPARFGQATDWKKNSGNFFLSMYIKLSSNWTNNGNAGTKTVFFRTDSTNANGSNHYLSFDENLAIGLQFKDHHEIYNANKKFPKGVWHRLEIWVKANTPGQNNGELRVWVDSIEIYLNKNYKDDYQLGRKDVMWFAKGQKPLWRALWFDGTYGGGKNHSPYDRVMYQLFDDLRLFVK